MKEHGYLFMADMVRALLRTNGPKTQTRRVITAHNSLVDGYGMSQKRWDAMRFDFYLPIIDQGPSPTGNPGPYLKVPSLTEVYNAEQAPWHRIYPRVQPGDRIWVKETWSADLPEITYRADNSAAYIDRHTDPRYSKLLRAFDRQRGDWQSSMHMPRWASRITLEITDVRVERLQDISEADARTEGARSLDVASGRETLDPNSRQGNHVAHYRHIWNEINGPDSWDKNPWVWVISFKRVQP